LDEGLISRGEAEAIREALRQRRQPDWTTSLGGGIGLHGGGGSTDWTAGCIALDDQAIEELDSVLRLGDPVEILP
jgi:lipoprotein-anchoring transpeptidase ErfK/SrfK